jgi:hypothetical protein
MSRNAKGGGSIRKRPDGRWEGRYTPGRNPGTGRQIQRSVYGKSQQEVRKKLQAVCVSINDGLYIDPIGYTVGQWLDIWLYEYMPNIKPSTLISYEGHIKNHIKPEIGAAKLVKLGAHHIQLFYNRLINGSSSAPPLAPKTVKNINGILHKSLDKALSLGFIKYNPAAAC